MMSQAELMETLQKVTQLFNEIANRLETALVGQGDQVDKLRQLNAKALVRAALFSEEIASSPFNTDKSVVEAGADVVTAMQRAQAGFAAWDALQVSKAMGKPTAIH